MTVDLDTTESRPLNIVAYPVTEQWIPSGLPSVALEIDYSDSLPYLGVLGGKADQLGEFMITELVQS